MPPLAAGQTGAIEIFQDLDSQVAAYAGLLAEHGCGERGPILPLRRRQSFRDARQFCRLPQGEEAILGNGNDETQGF